jgi:RNA polymerase sigma-70 factor (ECF subfamily)
MTGTAILNELDSTSPIRADEVAFIAELRAGSEDAYVRLFAQYHRPLYRLVYRIVNDHADAVDTTQEVFLKVYRGMKRFSGASGLKTWMYRIAVHEALNQRRWWFRHKSREITMEPPWTVDASSDGAVGLKNILADHNASPFEDMIHAELRARVEVELRSVPEPYRTTVILRYLEELSCEEIAKITRAPAGTVRSRLTRGRQALRKRFEPLLRPSRYVLNTCEMSCTCGD